MGCLCRLAAVGVVVPQGALWFAVPMVVLVVVCICVVCGRVPACPAVVALGRCCRGWCLAMVVCFFVVQVVVWPRTRLVSVVVSSAGSTMSGYCSCCVVGTAHQSWGCCMICTCVSPLVVVDCIHVGIGIACVCILRGTCMVGRPPGSRRIGCWLRRWPVVCISPCGMHIWFQPVVLLWHVVVVVLRVRFVAAHR